MMSRRRQEEEAQRNARQDVVNLLKNKLYVGHRYTFDTILKFHPELEPIVSLWDLSGMDSQAPRRRVTGSKHPCERARRWR